MLVGHLLVLATQGGAAGLPEHALAPLAGTLQARGLLPKWVHWALVHHPQLFSRAFQRLFKQACGPP